MGTAGAAPRFKAWLTGGGLRNELAGIEMRTPRHMPWGPIEGRYVILRMRLRGQSESTWQMACRTVATACLAGLAIAFIVGCDGSKSRVEAPTTMKRSGRRAADGSADVALAAFLAAHRDAAVHTGPVTSHRGHIAIVGLTRGVHDHVIAVVSLDHGAAISLATLALPDPSFDFATDTPPQGADMTGDGTPDVLVRVLGADNEPGVVVSNDGGTWRLVPVSNDTTDVYIARDPMFEAGHLTSTSDDCIPDCANGRVTKITWRYDRRRRQFAAG